LITDLERQGYETQLALELLATLEGTQTTHVADRDRLRAKLLEPFSDVGVRVAWRILALL